MLTSGNVPVMCEHVCGIQNNNVFFTDVEAQRDHGRRSTERETDRGLTYVTRPVIYLWLIQRLENLIHTVNPARRTNRTDTSAPLHLTASYVYSNQNANDTFLHIIAIWLQYNIPTAGISQCWEQEALHLPSTCQLKLLGPESCSGALHGLTSQLRTEKTYQQIYTK